MRRSFRTSSLIWSIGPLLLFVAHGTAEGEDALDRMLTEATAPGLAAKKWPGLVVGVCEGDTGRTRIVGFGRISEDDPRRPDGSTIFEIGSITKVFTAIALADLVEEGRVALADPLAKSLPDGIELPEPAGRPITLEDLATHTSGLPAIPPLVGIRAAMGLDPYATTDEKQVLDFLATHRPKVVAEPKHRYSNLGYGLLGMALAKRAGVSYPELVEGRIARPLGLIDTRFELDEARAKRLAPPHRSGGSRAISWRFDALAGCGGLKSTVDDLMRFARANLDADRGATRLDRAMRLAHSPRRETESKTTRIGLGWLSTSGLGGEDDLVWHNGGTGGYRSFCGFQRKTRHFVVVLANSDASVDAISLDVIRFLNDPSKRRALEEIPKK
ncbi:MAG: serine hydrolase domain-containing protein [Isosphaeraceae bacterium]|nr:serine hydrolase domain-containing protein [Isosphaeraceae bacterium]